MLAIHRITLAITNEHQMIDFYQKFFGCDFEPIPKYGVTLYRSSVNGVEFLLCPNQIAQINAHQARHQLEFVHQDVSQLSALIKSAGFNLISNQKTNRILVVKDPDGNNLIFSEN